MKTITTGLKNHLQGEVLTLATCWKLTRRDATVMGFTDHDRDLGVDGVTYRAATGFTPTAVASSASLSVDNLDIEGMLHSDTITEEDLMAGLYDHAEIEVFMLNYADMASGRIPLRVGWLGEVTFDGTRFIAEVRGLTQRLSQRVGELYSPSCRADLGDARCKVNLAGRTFTGTITGVTSRSVVHDTARTEDSGVFSFGTLRFVSGGNNGLTREIKYYTPGTMTVFLPYPYDIEAGDIYIITEGCDKTFETCISRFDNAVNFRGEPHVPGLDRLLETASTRSEWE